LHARAAQRGEHAEAFESARQHAVEHDRVVLVRDREDEAVAAGLCRLDGAAVIGQRLDDFLACLWIVLDDQYLCHAVSG